MLILSEFLCPVLNSPAKPRPKYQVAFPCSYADARPSPHCDLLLQCHPISVKGSPTFHLPSCHLRLQLVLLPFPLPLLSSLSFPPSPAFFMLSLLSPMHCIGSNQPMRLTLSSNSGQRLGHLSSSAAAPPRVPCGQLSLGPQDLPPILPHLAVRLCSKLSWSDPA